MEEIWKDIPGYEGYYQASNLGRVKGIERFTKARNNKKKLVKEKIRKSCMGTNGYLMVVLSKNGKTKSRSIHQLVAVTFLGHKPQGTTLVVDHTDNNKLNNNANNLRIILSRDNCIHIKKGTVKGYRINGSGRFESRISVNGRRINLGTYKTKEEAHQVYLKKKQELSQ